MVPRTTYRDEITAVSVAALPRNEAPMRSTTAPLAITLTALVVTVSACTASPGHSTSHATSIPEATPAPAKAALMPADPDARHECGQVSALRGIQYRSDWEHSEGLIDDDAYASRVAAIEDGWRYLTIGGTDVTPSIKAAQRALTAGGIGYENADFQRAMDEVALACDAAGSLISIGALPGQGG